MDRKKLAESILRYKFLMEYSPKKGGLMEQDPNTDKVDFSNLKPGEAQNILKGSQEGNPSNNDVKIGMDNDNEVNFNNLKPGEAQKMLSRSQEGNPSNDDVEIRPISDEERGNIGNFTLLRKPIETKRGWFLTTLDYEYEDSGRVRAYYMDNVGKPQMIDITDMVNLELGAADYQTWYNMDPITVERVNSLIEGRPIRGDLVKYPPIHRFNEIFDDYIRAKIGFGSETQEGVLQDPNKGYMGSGLPEYPENMNGKLTSSQYYQASGRYKSKDPEEESYISSCSEPDKALMPQEHKPSGLSGIEFLKAVNREISPDGKTKYTWCLYPYLVNHTIWLPSNSTIEFWDPELIDTFCKEYAEKQIEIGKQINNGVNPDWNNWTPEIVALRIMPYVRIGDVATVLVADELYVSKFKWDTGMDGTPPAVPVGDYNNPYTQQKILIPLGLKQKRTDEPIPKVKIIDPRNGVEKFIDDYGVVLQLGAAAVFFVGGLILEATGVGVAPGAALHLMCAEIAVDIVLGSAVAFRDYQKGNKLGLAMGVVFALASTMRLSKFLKGLKKDTVNSLAKKLIAENLDETSSADDWLRVYNTLNKEEQLALKYTFMNSDAMVQREIQQTLLNFGRDPESIKAMIKYAGNLMKQTGQIKSIPFLKTITAKEFGAQVFASFLDLGLEVTVGHKLHDENKKLLEMIDAKIPEKVKQGWQMNVLYNMENNRSEDVIEYAAKYIAKMNNFKGAKENSDRIVAKILDLAIEENGGADISEVVDDTQRPIVVSYTQKFVESGKNIEEFKKNYLSSAGWVTVAEVRELPFTEVQFTDLEPPYDILFNIKGDLIPNKEEEKTEIPFKDIIPLDGQKQLKIDSKQNQTINK